MNKYRVIFKKGSFKPIGLYWAALVFMLMLIGGSLSLSVVAQEKFAAPQVGSSLQSPVLIFDVKGNPPLPANLRSSKSPYQKTSQKTSQETLPTRLGLDELNISGSSQFTGGNLIKMLEALNLKKGYIVDLRQECHGFLGNIPVSWYGFQNAANKNKPDQEIFEEESKLLKELKHKNKVLVFIRTKANDKESNKNKISFNGIDVSYKTVLSEQEIVHLQHLNYLRLYIQDIHAPSNHEVDRFVEFMKKLPAGTWLHFHCHAGRGRTTTFMVLYDIIRNAHQVSLKDIIARQALIGGKDLTDFEEDKQWKNSYAKQRMTFIEKFYTFVKDPQGYKVQSWSGWLKYNRRE